MAVVDPMLQQLFVTISKDNLVRDVVAEQLEGYIYDIMREIMNMDRMYEFRDYYLNAFEWLLANISRTAGIQLYDDKEIRLNFRPSMIEDGKKCIFLGESPMENRAFDSVLYDELERLIMIGL